MKKIKRSIESFLEWCYDSDFFAFAVPIAILFILIVVTIIFGVNYNNLALRRGIEDYNNGICRDCGEPFEYKGSSRNRHYRYDYYICPNGHIIEVYKG